MLHRLLWKLGEIRRWQWKESWVTTTSHVVTRVAQHARPIINLRWNCSIGDAGWGVCCLRYGGWNGSVSYSHPFSHILPPSALIFFTSSIKVASKLYMMNSTATHIIQAFLVKRISLARSGGYVTSLSFYSQLFTFVAWIGCISRTTVKTTPRDFARSSIAFSFLLSQISPHRKLIGRSCEIPSRLEPIHICYSNEKAEHLPFLTKKKRFHIKDPKCIVCNTFS